MPLENQYSYSMFSISFLLCLQSARWLEFDLAWSFSSLLCKCVLRRGEQVPSVSLTEMLSFEKYGDSHWLGEDFLSIWLCFSLRPYSNGSERDRFTPSISTRVFDPFVLSRG